MPSEKFGRATSPERQRRVRHPSLALRAGQEADNAAFSRSRNAAWAGFSFAPAAVGTTGPSERDSALVGWAESARPTTAPVVGLADSAHPTRDFTPAGG